jgi:hypothetical protein
MAALAALGIAGNVVQFLEFASKLCVTGFEIYRDADGASAANAKAEALLKSFIDTVDEISSDLGQYSVALGAASEQTNEKDEAHIDYIISGCRVIAEDLLQRFDKLKSSGKPGKWKSFVFGMKCMWKKQELEDLRQWLKQYRKELEWRVLISLRYFTFPLMLCA